MPRLAPILIVTLPASALGWALGCGPSVQSIHEGNVRFEHCYRLDLDRNIAPSHRLNCWRQWTKTYAYGQTRDRLEYASRRIRHLTAGETSPPRLDLDNGQGEEPSPDPAGAPVPTSVHAPPPPIAATPEAGAPRPGDAGPQAEPESVPHAECIEECSKDWQACQKRCDAEAADEDRDCKGCKPDYRACLRRCLDEGD